MGILPEINTTDPYSPSPRAKAKINPLSKAGKIAGKITLRNVCNRFAPKLAAASSTSISSSSNTGCRERTMNGSPMKTRATKIPFGV